MKQLASGELNKKVTFQKLKKSDDGYNTPKPTDDFSKWVKIETGNPSEKEISGQLMGEVSHTITTRYSAKITAEHRIIHKCTVFEIIGKPINVNGANIITKIHCKEITHA